MGSLAFQCYLWGIVISGIWSVLAQWKVSTMGRQCVFHQLAKVQDLGAGSMSCIQDGFIQALDTEAKEPGWY